MKKEDWEFVIEGALAAAVLLTLLWLTVHFLVKPAQAQGAPDNLTQIQTNDVAEPDQRPDFALAITCFPNSCSSVLDIPIPS